VTVVKFRPGSVRTLLRRPAGARPHRTRDQRRRWRHPTRPVRRVLPVLMLLIGVVFVARAVDGDPAVTTSPATSSSTSALSPTTPTTPPPGATWPEDPAHEEGRAPALAGRPTRIADGDTLTLNGQRIRLQGIDAPEMSSEDGRGAKAHLAGLIGAGAITCEDTGQMSYDRIVGVCYGPDGQDLAMSMVADGWAVDLPRFSGGRYAAAERTAVRELRGMH
jgi:endonuclease YncB( thermonuclease family)